VGNIYFALSNLEERSCSNQSGEWSTIPLWHWSSVPSALCKKTKI